MVSVFIFHSTIHPFCCVCFFALKSISMLLLYPFFADCGCFALTSAARNLFLTSHVLEVKLSDIGHSPLKRRKVRALGIRTNYLLIRQDGSLTAALQPLPKLFLTEFFVSFSISRSSFRQRRQLADLDQVRNERRKRQQNRNQATSGGEEGHQKNAERSLLLQMKRFKIKKKFETNAMLIFFRLLRSFSNFLLLMPSQQICDLRYVLEEVSFQMVFE